MIIRFDGDQFALFPLFTKEANTEVYNKLHPLKTESVWTSSLGMTTKPYFLQLDAATALYVLTKE